MSDSSLAYCADAVEGWVTVVLDLSLSFSAGFICDICFYFYFVCFFQQGTVLVFFVIEIYIPHALFVDRNIKLSSTLQSLAHVSCNLYEL